MGVIKDLKGKEFGRLKVIERVGSDKNGHSKWLCECSCGNPDSIIILGTSLISGATKSCGCFRKEVVSERFKKYNEYDLSEKFGIGWTTNTNEEFYFDIADYEKIKDYCWYCNSNGYIVTYADDEIIYIHRLIMGVTDDYEVDHKDHKIKDNRKDGLRICNRQKNSFNKQKTNRKTSSKYKGIYLHPKNNIWIAQITYNGKTLHIGSFTSEVRAVKAYNNKAIELFKEYAKLNIIDEVKDYFEIIG